MFRGGIRSLALLGGLLAGGTALAACGGGAAGQLTSISGGDAHPVPGASTTVPASGAPAPTTTVPAPTTTVAAPGSTTPISTAPAPVATAPPTAPASGAASAPPAAEPSTPASTAAPTPSSGPVLITRAFNGTINYEGREPSGIGFSVDSTNVVTHLTWASWGPATAVGHGTLGLNDCKPNCAAGTVTPVPATITLSGVSSGHFTAITETAGSMSYHYDFPGDWAVSAS